MRTPVSSPLPGTLAMLYADDGDVVAVGDPIGEVECMKVNHRIEAPASGTLRWTRELGEVVGQGETVAEVTSDG